MRLMSPCNSTEPDAGKHMNQILFKCNFIWPVRLYIIILMVIQSNFTVSNKAKNNGASFCASATTSTRLQRRFSCSAQSHACFYWSYEVSVMTHPVWLQ